MIVDGEGGKVLEGAGRVLYSAATLGNLNFWRFVRPDEYQEALLEAFEILTSSGGKLFNVTESYVKG
jgi:hypothetical protein